MEKLIQNSGLVTGIFGSWPPFHDAEIINFDLWRGDVDDLRDRWVFPQILATFRVWTWVRKSVDSVCLVRAHDSFVRIRFHSVDHLVLNGFDHQNSIGELRIEERVFADGPSPLICVDIVREITGPNISFRCSQIEVVEARSWRELGEPDA